MTDDVPGGTYSRLLSELADSLERLDPPQRLAVLHRLISPLLDQVEATADDELFEEQEMTTSEAVQRFRRAGEDGIDLAAVHYHLTYYALLESEDQDRMMHVRSQAAWLAAQWLQLHTGGPLPAVEDFFHLDSLAGILNSLAWTRTGQVEILAEDAEKSFADGCCDLPAAISDLEPIREVVRNPVR